MDRGLSSSRLSVHPRNKFESDVSCPSRSLCSKLRSAYRVISLTRKRLLLGPYSRRMPRTLRWSQGPPTPESVFSQKAFLWTGYSCTGVGLFLGSLRET